MNLNENTTSILISSDEQDPKVEIPTFFQPNRASVSTNFITALRQVPSGGLGLVLHNFDPITYSTWYPLFHFSPWNLLLTPTTYADLLSTVLDDCPNELRIEAHRLSSELHIRTKLGLTRFSSSPKALVPQEVWLKYSKSKKQWTVYRFDYFMVVDLNHEEVVANANLLNLGFLPLEGKLFIEASTSGMFQGIAIVDNLLRLLRDAPVLSRIMSGAI